MKLSNEGKGPHREITFDQMVSFTDELTVLLETYGWSFRDLCMLAAWYQGGYIASLNPVAHKKAFDALEVAVRDATRIHTEIGFD